MKKSLLALTIASLLTACGGGGGGSDAPAKEPNTSKPVVEAPVTEPVVEAPVVEEPVVEEPIVEEPVVEVPKGPYVPGTITAPTGGIIGTPYEVEYDVASQVDCTINGDAVDGTGSVFVTATEVGRQTTTMTCGGDYAITVDATVSIIPEIVNIPDPHFADALVRLGHTVTNGTMDAEDVLKIEKLCIVGLNDWFSSPTTEQNTALVTNTSVDMYGEYCAYMDHENDEWVTDTTGLEHFVNLTGLELVYEKIKTINVAPLQQLLYLNLMMNPLETIDLSKNVKLDHLTLIDTSLTELDVTALRWLTNLQLKVVDNLETYKDLPYTMGNGAVVSGLTELDLTQNKVLKYIWLGGNPMKELNFGDNVNSIQQLYINGMKLEGHLDLSKFTRLRNIFPYGNDEVTSIDIRGIDPRRFYVDNMPMLDTVYTHDLTLFDNLNMNGSGKFADAHTNFVELAVGAPIVE